MEMTLHDQAESIAPKLRVISLGAGVQSTTMALMAAHGEIGPMPDAAIFADTGYEPKAVYKHLDWLMSGVLPFPVAVVSAGNIREDTLTALAGGSIAARGAALTAPFFSAGGGPLNRQCTRHYKIDPINKHLRGWLGLKARRRLPKSPVVEVWMGISTDEAARMKPSREAWIAHRYPLIEADMSRWACLRWMERNGYPKPPKSACIFCPYHNDNAWRDLRDNDPDGWADAIEMDATLRKGRPVGSGGQVGTDALYLHRSLKPLDQVDLSTLEDHGQLNLFNNECEGLCGV